MPKISYRVTLTQEERNTLHEISHNGKRSARIILNALILLGVDQGEYQDHRNQSERDLSAALHVSPCSINNLKKRFVEEGFEAAVRGNGNCCHAPYHIRRTPRRHSVGGCRGGRRSTHPIFPMPDTPCGAVPRHRS